MSKVIIKCNVLNDLNIYFLHLSITGSNLEEKIERKIRTQQEIEFSLKEGIYQILITGNPDLVPQVFQCTFVVTNQKDIFIPLCFRKAYLKQKTPIIIHLRDRHYQDLKVERGKISLWTKHIQLTSSMVVEQKKS